VIPGGADRRVAGPAASWKAGREITTNMTTVRAMASRSYFDLRLSIPI